MNPRDVQLVDRFQTVLGEAQVTQQGDLHGGTIDLRTTPSSIRSLFDEFEEVVNGQMFVFLDEIEAKINSLTIKVVFDDGFERLIKDLQVFPEAGELSFRLADQPGTDGDIASSTTRSGWLQ